MAFDEDETANVTSLETPTLQPQDAERRALITIDPKGTTIRPPPKPHENTDEVTPDDRLFQTIHMGAAVVDDEAWRLVVDGLVSRPLTITLAQLKSMPSTTVTTFHECYGSPIAPPTKPLYRIGNVRWTGVKLPHILSLAQIDTSRTKYIWSEGLDSGTFAHITADRYQKDLPLDKAMDDSTLLAYFMNDEPLTKERGRPVRLVVPGWFGTNATKWLCHLSAQPHRAPGPFTTDLYNELDPSDPEQKRRRPVWQAEVNSMICHLRPGEKIEVSTARGGRLSSVSVLVWGRAWGAAEIQRVQISVDGGLSWLVEEAQVQPRREFEWQRFETRVLLTPDVVGATYTIVVRAWDRDGVAQPLQGRRNHVHSVEVEVVGRGSS